MVQIASRFLDAYVSSCLGRRDDYAVQQDDGRYLRVGLPLTSEVLFSHLQGIQTIGTYVINEEGLCHFAVFDSDTLAGLADLAQIQTTLVGGGVPSYLELSRRGGHLWVFLSQPALPALVRAWLLPYCPVGVEFYPKQDGLSSDVPFGSLVRLPLGVHRLTRQRYPFVLLVEGRPVPVMTSLIDGLAWFTTVARVAVPASIMLATQRSTPTTQHTLHSVTSGLPASGAPWSSIREWCLAHDPLEVIGRYVALSANGLGCCPFGWHHEDSVDNHPSLWVHRPSSPGDLSCWYCHTWRQGGSLFDFFRLYYGLEACDLWQRILNGARF
jgi:hypothetical protein